MFSFSRSQQESFHAATKNFHTSWHRVKGVDLAVAEGKSLADLEMALTHILGVTPRMYASEDRSESNRYLVVNLVCAPGQISKGTRIQVDLAVYRINRRHGTELLAQMHETDPTRSPIHCSLG
jgi:hypothetical protein